MFSMFRKLKAKPARPALSRGARALAKLSDPLPTVPEAPRKPRPGLKETLRTIQAGGMPVTPATAMTALTLPRGASFTTAIYGTEQGQRTYRLYLPSTYPAAAPMPLIVMLHGCAQTPDDFAAGTRMNALAEEFGFIVAYPSQPRGANSNRCWNWYKRAEQGRNGDEPSLISGITREILWSCRVDSSRVYVAGLSAGGSAAAILGAAYPDIFAAVGIHSGMPVGAARDATSGLLAMRHGAPGDRPTVAVPTIVIQGDADRVVNPGNGRYATARALVPYSRLIKTERRTCPADGRPFTRTIYRGMNGRAYVEHWVIEGAGHAWAGGSPAGSFSDPNGPDASRAMVRFFLRHRNSTRRRNSTPQTP